MCNGLSTFGQMSSFRKHTHAFAKPRSTCASSWMSGSGTCHGSREIGRGPEEAGGSERGSHASCDPNKRKQGSRSAGGSRAGTDQPQPDSPPRDSRLTTLTPASDLPRKFEAYTNRRGTASIVRYAHHWKRAAPPDSLVSRRPQHARDGGSASRCLL